MPARTNLTLPSPITDAELLAAVRRCIHEITLHGQSFSFDGMEKTMADLGRLREMEADLQNRVAAGSLPVGGVRTSQVVF